MKFLMLFFVCVALVSFHGARGEEKEKVVAKEDVEDEEEGRRQFPAYAMGLSPAQAAAQAAANANAYRPTPWPTPRPTPWPTPRPTTRPTPHLYNCYSCNDCPDVRLVPPQKVCTPYNQRCVVYVEKYNYRRQPVYVRGCVSERGTCEDIRRSHERRNIKLLSCDECVGDLCNKNGVARSLPDLTAALFFVILTPVLTKYALS